MKQNSFTEINLSPEIVRAIKDLNYTEMTEIQANAIPILLEGYDVVGRSSTGTGKTAAFGIPAVESIVIDGSNKPQVLIICPTRELAKQISDEIKKYAKYKSGISVATVYGGESFDIQIRQIKKAKIIVGTPGRIMDHTRRRTLKLDEIKTVVLDEADEMLNMGFLDDMRQILSDVPIERQTVLFSATMPPAIMKITKEFQKDPQIVAVDKGQRTLDTISQYFYQIPQPRKMDAVNLILQMDNPKRCIIFCNTKRMVDDLVEYLATHSFKCAGIHGDMKQNSRSQVMNDFKLGRTQILVATDVAARGIDVEDIEMVINFDIPMEFEYYIHRIGRTGRAGKIGSSHTLVCNKLQFRKIKEVQSFINAEIIERHIPSIDEINKKKSDKFMQKVKKGMQGDLSEHWYSYLNDLVADGYELELIAATLLKMLAGKDKKTVAEISNISKTSFTGGFIPNTNKKPFNRNNYNKNKPGNFKKREHNKN